MTTALNADFTFLVNGLTQVPGVRHAIVLSTDGILMAASGDLPADDAEHLAAAASAMHSLAQGVSDRFRGNQVRQAVVELEGMNLFVSAAGPGACLAVLASHEADVGLVAFEMARLAKRAGAHLTTPARSTAPPAGE